MGRGGQVAVAVAQRSSQAGAEGQFVGRCRTSRRPEEAIRAWDGDQVGAQKVAQRALAWRGEAAAPTARRKWCLPVSDDLVGLARDAGAVAVFEDNLVVGGVGSQILLALQQAGVAAPVDLHGIPKRFLHVGSRGEVLEEIGLTPDAIADRLTAVLGH